MSPLASGVRRDAGSHPRPSGRRQRFREPSDHITNDLKAGEDQEDGMKTVIFVVSRWADKPRGRSRRSLSRDWGCRRSWRLLCHLVASTRALWDSSGAYALVTSGGLERRSSCYFEQCAPAMSFSGNKRDASTAGPAMWMGLDYFCNRGYV